MVLVLTFHSNFDFGNIHPTIINSNKNYFCRGVWNVIFIFDNKFIDIII